MERRSIVSTITGDISGGLTAAILALPESIAYGCLVLAPLGPEFIPMGIVVGLISLAFMNLGTAPFGIRGIMISAPFSLSSLMLASTLTFIITKVNPGSANFSQTVLAILFIVVLIAGFFQILFGFLRLGQLTKYIPYPVISGLFNGTAILIFFGQMNTFLGIPDSVKILSLFNEGTLYAAIQPLTLVIGFLTILFIWKGENISKKIPAPVLGILAGTLFYYFIKYLIDKRVISFFLPEEGTGWISQAKLLGPVVGTIKFESLMPSFGQNPEFFAGFMDSLFTGLGNGYWSIIIELIPLSLGIALILSLRSLISLISADNLTTIRSNSNLELISQGIGNMTSALFGGIAGAGSVSATVANYKYGGRTFITKIVTGSFVLAILILLHPIVSLLPKVVLSAMLIFLSISIFDSWIFELIRQLFSAKAVMKKEFLVNIFLVLLVTLVMIFIGIFKALLVGLGVSVLMFVVRMGKDVIRRQFSGDKLRSNVERPEGEIRILEAVGARIQILELEGSLFFGTADKISEKVSDLLKQETEFIILDFKRISDIDSTGIHIVQQLSRRCATNNTFLIFSSLDKNAPGYSILKDLKYCYESLEDALAWAEDQIINRLVPEEKYQLDIPLREIDSLLTLTDEEIEILERTVERITYKEGSVVFKEGDSGNMIYFIANGRAHIFVGFGDEGKRKRISTLSRGTIFGEMALIDRKPRSAAVIADKKLVCYTLERKKLTILSKSHPKIAYKIIMGLTKELSKRIRIINNMVTQLKN